MEETFDAVVVGSGFGGSVMTYELARAGMRVCLLERGKAYAPGEFARSPHQMGLNLWDPSAGLHGMFNIWRFQNLDAIVSSGLGGGSLIYANVLLRMPRTWFENDPWPIQYDELVKHYGAAEKLLGGQKFPFDRAPYNKMPRAQVFRQAVERAAGHLGADLGWEDLSLSISFAGPDGVAAPGRLLDKGSGNLHERPRVTCQLCGECDIGCNHGSKNTLDYTCLSAAHTLGATIRPRCEVRWFEPIQQGDAITGYRVGYVDHSNMEEGRPRDDNDPHRQPTPHTIVTRQLILAAGTLGTTFLLLRNRERFPELSDCLGSRFSGNGDLLGLAIRRRNGQSDMDAPPIDPSYGPVITSCAGFLNGVPQLAGGRSGRGFFIQDAGFPHALNWALHLMPGNLLRTAFERYSEQLHDTWDSFVNILREHTLDSSARTDRTDVGAPLADILRMLSQEEWFPLLGMGQDTPDGRIWFDPTRQLAQVDWEPRASRAYFDDVRLAMKAIAEAMGAGFASSLSWPIEQAITVHPLGGCPIGRDAGEGVVDVNGEVFRGERRYDGLFVADGSVMAGPTGANPSLTIAALAHRFAEKVIQNHR